MSRPTPNAQGDHYSEAPVPPLIESDALRRCYSDNVGGPYQFPQAFITSPSLNSKLPGLEITGACGNQLQGAKMQEQASAPAKPEVKDKKDQPPPQAKPAETKIDRLKDQAHTNGFTIKIVNGKYEYHQKVDGKDVVAFTTDGTEADANRHLHDLVEKKEAALTAKYGVQFGKEGDKVAFKDLDGNPVSGECREPTLRELDGLDAALAKNQYTPDGKPGPPFPKVDFLKENLVPGMSAAFAPDQNTIFAMPALADTPGVTAKDTDPYLYTAFTIEGLFSHELNHWAHDWDDRQKGKAAGPTEASTNSVQTGTIKPEDTPAPTTPNQKTDAPKPADAPKAEAPPPPSKPTDSIPEPTETDTARYERLGWKQITTTDGTKEWVVEATDHHLYVCVTGTDGQRAWVRVDEQGEPIDKNGKRILNPDDSDAEINRKLKASAIGFKDDDGMAGHMSVPPISRYFTSPEEELSEAGAYFHSKDNRSYLAHTDWPLYQEAKQMDQERINEANGVGPNGEPLYIRSPDGKIVPNDEVHRAEVSTFEDAARQPSKAH